jgi:hypothetical protein
MLNGVYSALRRMTLCHLEENTTEQEIIMLSEISHAENSKYEMFLFISRKKNEILIIMMMIL